MNRRGVGGEGNGMRCGQRGQQHSFVKQGKVVPLHLKCTRHPLKPLLRILSKGKGMWFDLTFKCPLAACSAEKQRPPPPPLRDCCSCPGLEASHVYITRRLHLG